MVGSIVILSLIVFLDRCIVNSGRRTVRGKF